MAPELGLTLGWKVDTHWEALLGVDEYFKVGDSKYGTFSVLVLSFGLQYHF